MRTVILALVLLSSAAHAEDAEQPWYAERAEWPAIIRWAHDGLPGTCVLSAGNPAVDDYDRLAAAFRDCRGVILAGNMYLYKAIEIPSNRSLERGALWPREVTVIGFEAEREP